MTSSNHLIRPRQYVGRNRQADLLGGFQIDHQLEFCWLLYGEVTRLGTLQNFVHINSGTPVQVGNAHAVADEPSGVDKFSPAVQRRQSALYCEVGNLFSLRIEDKAVHHEDAVSTQLARLLEHWLNVSGSSHVEVLKFSAERTCTEFCVS